MNSTYKKYKNSYSYFIDNKEIIYYHDPKTGLYEIIANLDLDSFTILTNGYSHDKNTIYYGATPIGKNYVYFKDYAAYGYFKIDQTLYWYGEKIRSHFDSDLQNISHNFFTNGQYLFVNGKIFNFDQDSFIVLNTHYAKDKYAVFYSEKVVKEADPLTFKILPTDSGYPESLIKEYPHLKDKGSSNWATDKNNLYFCGKVMLKDKIDPTSAKVIKNRLVLDRTSVYFNNIKVEGADPETFQAIINKCLDLDSVINQIKFFTRFYKDKHSIYYYLEDQTYDIKDKIIRCEKENYALFRQDLKLICNDFSKFNLSSNDIDNIKKIIL